MKTSAVGYVVNKLWLLLAILLLTVALLLSALRFALPYLDHYRVDIENWIESTYEQRVDIGHLKASWGANGPELVLEDLSFAGEEDLSVRFSIGSLRVALRFWETLWQRQLILEDLIFDQVVLEFEIRPESSEPMPLYDSLLDLLFIHLTHFQLKNSHLHMIDSLGETRVLQVDTLQWLNKEGKRQATGRFRVPEVANNHLNFIIDLENDRQQGLSGRLYAKAEQLDISPWIKTLTQTAEIDLAEFNLEAWLDFKNNQFTQGQLHFSENFLEWHRDKESRHRLTTGANTWLLTPLDGGWVMNSEPFTVTIDDQQWPIETMIWQYQEGLHLWNLHEIEIRDFGPLWSLFGSPGEAVRFWSEGLQPQGRVDAFKVRLTPQREWQFYGVASNLSWQPFSAVPGIGGLNVEFWSTPYEGRFEIKGEQLNFYSPIAYAESQVVDRLHWQGFWERTSEAWFVRMPLGRMSISHIEFIQDIRLSAEIGAQPNIEWAVRSFPNDIEALKAMPFLPLQLGEQLNSYLKEALHAGKVEQLGMLWRGPLVDFPYHSSDGVFQAGAQLRDVAYKFQPDWPLVYAPHVTLDYDRDKLTIQAPRAQLMEVQAQEVQVQLPNLLDKDLWLFVEAKVAGQAKDAAEFFEHSPLENSVGETLKQVVPQGDLAGEFRLGVPFFDADIELAGEVDIAPQAVHFTALNQTLEQVSGRLNFDLNKLHFTSQSAQWYGLPLEVQVSGAVQEVGYQVEAQVQAHWHAHQVAQAFPEAAWLNQLAGEFSSEAGFLLRLDEAGDFDYRWQMQTNTTALASQLPEPLAKAPGEIRFLNLEVLGDKTELSLYALLEKSLEFKALLNLGEDTFSHAHLHLGERPLARLDSVTEPATLDASLPLQESDFKTAGSVISISSQAVDGNAWLGFLFDTQTQIQENSTKHLVTTAEQKQGPSILEFFPELRRFELYADQFQLGFQEFEQVQVELSKNPNWQGSLNANQARVQFSLTPLDNEPGNQPESATEQEVATQPATAGQLLIEADFLELSPWQQQATGLGKSQEQQVEEVEASAESAKDWSPLYESFASWPRVSFICRICRYGAQDLGRVTFGLEPSQEGQQIPYFRVLRSGVRLDASAGWKKNQATGEYQSQLQVNSGIKNISSLLNEWGYNSVVRDSELQAQTDLSWPGGPLEIKKERLSGQASFEFGAGYLRDISDGGARMLSVLSLESIVRKLQLDFRDLFSRGLFYSRFSGDLQLKDGVVSTDNTELIGAVGDLSVRGETNLHTEILDYRLALTPKVTSSLPVLVAWMVNPPSGLAALFIDKVLQEAKVISKLQYELTGTLAEPKVKEVRRDSKPVGDEIDIDRLPPEQIPQEKILDKAEEI